MWLDTVCPKALLLLPWMHMVPSWDSGTLNFLHSPTPQPRVSSSPQSLSPSTFGQSPSPSDPLPKCLKSDASAPLLTCYLHVIPSPPAPHYMTWAICLSPFFLPHPLPHPDKVMSLNHKGSSLSCLNWTTPVGFHLFPRILGIHRYTRGGSQFSKSIFYLTLCFHSLNDSLFKDYY